MRALPSNGTGGPIFSGFIEEVYKEAFQLTPIYRYVDTSSAEIYAPQGAVAAVFIDKVVPEADEFIDRAVGFVRLGASEFGDTQPGSLTYVGFVVDHESSPAGLPGFAFVAGGDFGHAFGITRFIAA